MSPVITKVYGEHDTGCFVDNCRGIYMVDRIVEIANQHGANIRHDCNPTDCAAKARQIRQLGPDTAGDGSLTVYSRCDFADEYCDKATNYLNENYGSEGYYWGFADHSGDWGFWIIHDEDAPTPEREKFAHALSERTGKDIDPLDVRIEGGWLFYRDIDNPLEIECYRLSLPTCVECLANVSYAKSPFKPDNAKAVSRTIQRLDKEYADDVDDFPDSLPLGGTTAIFFTPPETLDDNADTD